MTQKKTYTNTDIIKRLDAMDTWRNSMDGRMTALEVYKISQDSGRAAVDDYINRQAVNKNRKDRDSAYSSIKDLAPYVVALLVAIAAYIYTHTGGH